VLSEHVRVADITAVGWVGDRGRKEMPSLKEKSDRSMAATEVIVRDEDRDDDSSSPQGQPPRSQPSSGGFFTIYKKGQGYWTRMGTAGAAALIGGLIIYNLFQYLPTLGVETRKTVTIVAAVFGVVYVLFVYWLMNRSTNAEFMIATDSEMKKVNWTSRKELIGSTRVVVVFMILIAIILFVIDVLFQTFFYMIDVLKVPPFFIKG